MEVKQYAEDALTVTLANEVDEAVNASLVQIKEIILNQDFKGVTDIVLSYTSLIIYFDILTADKNKIIDVLENIDFSDLSSFEPSYKVVEIPVYYGGKFGPDISRFKEKGLSEEEVIEMHSNKEYLVYMLGFMPGFPYLGGLDEKLYMARLDSPRKSIPAGSVGIGGQQTGMYPFQSPGGWNLLGRTPIPLYDKNRDQAILYEAGDRIIYRAIDEKEYYDIEEAYKNGDYQVTVEHRGDSDGN